MEVQVEKTSSYLRKLSVTLPAGRVAEAFENAYRSIAKRVTVPGFRKGKVPRGLLEARFREDAEHDVVAKLVEESLQEALLQNHVVPIDAPKIEPGDLTKNASFSYTAQVEVKPDIELQKVEGLKVPKIRIEVSEEDVDEALALRRKQAAELVPVMIRDVVQEGDVVFVDYEGTIGGASFEGASGKNAQVEIGGAETLPGFSEGLVGAKVPSERTLSVDFPDEYPVPAVAGKAASFHVTLKELKTKELPELDDEFAKDLGKESLEQLRQETREGLLEARKAAADSVRRAALVDDLLRSNPIEVPPSLIESETDRMIAGAARRLEQSIGSKIHLSSDDLSHLREDGRQGAIYRVSSALLLMTVAEKHQIEVSDDDVQGDIDKILAAMGQVDERVRSYYNDPDLKAEIRYRLLENKTIDFLLEKAEEVEMPDGEAASDAAAVSDAEAAPAPGGSEVADAVSGGPEAESPAAAETDPKRDEHATAIEG